MSPLDVIKGARAYLDKPERWAKGNMYADRFGVCVPRHKASCACLLGALNMGSDGRGTQDKRDAVSDAIDILDIELGTNVVAFNDAPTTTFEDVTALLDRVIYRG